MSTARNEHLTIGYPPKSTGSRRTPSPVTHVSPVEATASSSIKSPFGMSGLSSSSRPAGASRSGTGSPSQDAPGSGRLFSKRAREIQAQEGITMPVNNPWGGPPTSGNSTPLRENIPESPTDGFPDFAQLPTPDSLPSTRRARAGTVPSRFPPGGLGNGLLPMPSLSQSSSSRPTPSQSPYNKTPSPGLSDNMEASRSSALLSRLRAGSMPQRSPFLHNPGTSSPFGPSVFSTWNPSGGRERGNTLASIASAGSNGPSSPAQSAVSKEGSGDNDVHMRTLDYLGLAETPQPARAQLTAPYLPGLADYTRQANRFRSYSVNNKDKYADEEDYDDESIALDNQYAQLQEQLAATNAAIHSHNLAVQSLQTLASNAVTRPRARTAGLLDLTGAGSRLGARNYYPTPSRLDSSMTAADIGLGDDKEYDALPSAVAAMNLGRSNSRNNGLLTADEPGLEGPTSALWLGSIPTSTTPSTLTEMFKSYGPVQSARVLTHKNCGFVNFERVESAIAAKSGTNGKEIFPGAGPIRINFAKPASASGTPGHDGAFPSPSPDPFAKNSGSTGATGSGPAAAQITAANTSASAPNMPALPEMTGDIVQIVKSFGATDEDTYRISQSLQQAIQYTTFIDEIPAIQEPVTARVHDAPKLRDIRKRIDNQSLSQTEIESIAVDMLPEIAELSSDYLGNTVVQKLFQECSDNIRDAMLAEIAPHLAKIGVHKNGTWAAQKIIDVCKTPHQLSMIVEHLRPYTIPLFLDQYGNYVLQGCLQFGAPFNDFIFETMLSRMWEISQGRYGARAMRACLESHSATKEQQRMLAAAIALHSVRLATNANGALLLTWFLDTCTFPQRRSVLAPQLVPYLVHLCTHKVAYLTVLKVINQKAESDARDAILQALFFTPKDQTLEAILSDHACGATLIFKVLTTPFFDESIRGQVVENVKNVLIRIKAQPNQGYKRLMDEVGMSSRNGGNSASRDHSVGPHASGDRQRSTSRQAQAQANAAAVQQNAQYGNQFINPLNPAAAAGFDVGGFPVPRSDNGEQAMPYAAYGPPGGMYNGANGSIPPMNMQQLQYQQSMMSRGTPPMNNFYPQMQAGFGGYNNANAPMDQLRGQNVANGSPVQPTGGAAGFAPPGFGMGVGVGGYGYPNGGISNIPYVPEQPVGSRRGRVGHSSRQGTPRS
ncbi:hypothetical protein F5Y18DRAFT_210435 [Xylariaceae sp. FL1019]|nr:hypothetical protein F5Y18DRAFT_210435 [Xylariaceae sp. FL1019]